MRTIIHHHPVAPERLILKKIPKFLLGGIFIPLFISILSRLLSIIEPIDGTAAEIARHQTSIDILCISLYFMVASASFTVSLVCVIVALMRSPAYVANAYELEKFAHPRLDKNNKRVNR
jgi:hypothetical protein